MGAEARQWVATAVIDNFVEHLLGANVLNGSFVLELSAVGLGSL